MTVMHARACTSKPPHAVRGLLMGLAKTIPSETKNAKRKKKRGEDKVPYQVIARVARDTPNGCAEKLSITYIFFNYAGNNQSDNRSPVGGGVHFKRPEDRGDAPRGGQDAGVHGQARNPGGPGGPDVPPQGHGRIRQIRQIAHGFNRRWNGVTLSVGLSVPQYIFQLS